MKIALGIEYEGTYYRGWQAQSNLPTIQSCLEQALAKVAAHSVTTVCAGRTDAGVHATGQVVHFETNAMRSEKAWILGANRYLPADIAVRWARCLPDDFHARYSALARRYHYWIYNHSQRPILSRHHLTWCYWPLLLEPMKEAANYLLGEQDFSSFRGADCQFKSPIRHLIEISITRQNQFFLLDIKANSFLHHMVRNIAGVLLMIGAGKRPVQWMESVLKARRRTAAGITAPPQGLYLVEVDYPKTYSLPMNTSQSFLVLKNKDIVF